MPRIDAHHHLWPTSAISQQAWRPQNDHVLRRAFETVEFEAELEASGIDGSILMQSVDAWSENDRLSAYAAESTVVRGWVGWADLPDPVRSSADVQSLAMLRSAPGGEKLVGVRCLVGSDPMHWTATEEGIRTLGEAAAASLVWDTVPITDAQVDAVAAAAERVPSLRIVVDHLASPPMTDAGFPEWRRRLERLSAPRNVAIKLSVGVAVLQRWDDWDPRSLRPYLDTALELFGADRCMVASNWPVVLIRASHREAWRGVTDALEDLDTASKRLVEGQTALRWYGIGE